LELRGEFVFCFGGANVGGGSAGGSAGAGGGGGIVLVDFEGGEFVEEVYVVIVSVSGYIRRVGSLRSAPSSSSLSSSSSSESRTSRFTGEGAEVSVLGGSAPPVGWASSLGATSGSFPFSMVGRYCIVYGSCGRAAVDGLQWMSCVDGEGRRETDGLMRGWAGRGNERLGDVTGERAMTWGGGDFFERSYHSRGMSFETSSLLNQ
jgi:hypothetical protein